MFCELEQSLVLLHCRQFPLPGDVRTRHLPHVRAALREQERQRRLQVQHLQAEEQGAVRRERPRRLHGPRQ